MRHLFAWAGLVASLAVSACADVFTHVSEAAEPGPVIVVLGAVDEYGGMGAQAARQMAHWKPQRGTLVCGVVHSFLSNEPESSVLTWYEGGLADLLTRYSPTLVVVLREDHDFHGTIPSARGATISADDSEAAQTSALVCMTGINKTIPNAGETWSIQQDDKPTSHLLDGTPTLVLTTSAKDPRRLQRPALRARQFRIGAHAILTNLGVVAADASPHVLLSDECPAGATRVAIYDDQGCISSSGHDPLWIAQSLRHLDMVVELVGREEIVCGSLQQFDVVVFGGGSSNDQGRGLGAEGAKAVRTFVERGGGYVGICAGGFLACSDREDDLHLLDATHEGTSGEGILQVNLADSAIADEGSRSVKFSGGPIFKLPADSTCEVWGTFSGDLPRKGREPLRLKGTPAVLAAGFGRGRVVAFSPHPERAPGPRDVFWSAVAWAAGAK